MMDHQMQITLNLLMANRVVNTHDKELVFFNHLKNVLQSHLPTLSAWCCLKNSIGILNKRPLHQIINILDRKSTRLNSSHVSISYAVFCLQKKTLYHWYKSESR